MSTPELNKQIVVIEQEAFLARIISRGLRKSGFEVRHISDGDAALSILAERIPDYVIVAAEMDPMSGEEFCRRLQSDHPDRSFPVFVMTDSARDMNAKWNQWFSNFRMVEKPISLRYIIDCIEQHEAQAA